MDPKSVQEILSQTTEHIGRVVFGAQELTSFAFIAAMSRGHLLLEGLPGTGKTLFAQCFARSMGLGLRRLQCTPDLMPGDVLGANIFDFASQRFTLTKGPVFTQCLLADEINRTPPKTQSALLEAMQERAVTIDGTTHKLDDAFTVIATQNPIEHEGTYPLPEAQLDRFLFKLVVDFPDAPTEVEAVLRHGGSAGAPDLDALGLTQIVSSEVLEQLRLVPQNIRMETDIADYVVRLARASREHVSLQSGISLRAATMLAASARALAACEGRDFVLPDDVKKLFIPLARHRVILSTTAEMEGIDAESVLNEIIQQVNVPR